MGELGVQGAPMEENLGYIPIAALNQYDYCPRRCYYIYVEEVFEENAYTVEGSLLHARVDSGHCEKRGDLVQLRSVTLYSLKYGIYGKSDLIEIKKGEMYPVEYKRGHKGKWKNDALQLCAQTLCLEDTLNRKIDRGYIYYALSERREEVKIDEKLRAETLKMIEQVWDLFLKRKRPDARYGPRCRGCSLIGICLPKETDKVRDFIRKQNGKSVEMEE